VCTYMNGTIHRKTVLAARPVGGDLYSYSDFLFFCFFFLFLFLFFFTIDSFDCIGVFVVWHFWFLFFSFGFSATLFCVGIGGRVVVSVRWGFFFIGAMGFACLLDVLFTGVNRELWTWAVFYFLFFIFHFFHFVFYRIRSVDVGRYE